MRTKFLFIILCLSCVGWTYNGTWKNTGDLNVDGLTVSGDQVISGNLGIGSTSPRGKLDVDGKVYADDVEVSGTLTATTIATTGADERIYGTETYLDFNEADKMLYVGAFDGARLAELKVDGSIYAGNSINGTAAMQVRARTDGFASGLSVSRVDGGSAIHIYSDTSARGRIDAGGGGSQLTLNAGSTGSSTGSVTIGTTTGSARVTIAGASYPVNPNFVSASGAADMILAGDLEVDKSIYAGNGATLLSDTDYGGGYFASKLEADGGIYLGSSVFMIKQPDGGCSQCGVDAAGTTWSCANVTCITGL